MVEAPRPVNGDVSSPRNHDIGCIDASTDGQLAVVVKPLETGTVVVGVYLVLGFGLLFFPNRSFGVLPKQFHHVFLPSEHVLFEVANVAGIVEEL